MPEYTFYKLSFTTGVHLGNGLLSTSDIHFRADTLFSALYLEAMKQQCADALYQAVADGKIRLSDAFPFVRDQYCIPKPMLHIESENAGNSVDKKFYKNLKYLPVAALHDFLHGQMKKEDAISDVALFSTRTMVNLTERENKEARGEALPYQVGVSHFHPEAGLYFIAETSDDESSYLLGDLLQALASSGIGGKRSQGLGRFVLKTGNRDEALMKRITAIGSSCNMLVSTALPKEEELPLALAGASYSMVPRAGFVYSETFDEEPRKKHTLYAMDAGSCFKSRFDGDIYDVSRGGKHPVYRYAKSMFLSLDGDLL